MPGILVVEDNNTIRMMYTAGLQGLGLSVLEARTIEQAKELLGNGSDVKIVLLDLRLPGEPGHHLIPYIRGELKRDDIRIIVASAWSEMEQTVLDAGADVFVRKPLDMPALLQQIQQFSRL
jgi:two-component system, chemotaxis family, chemotaxis protein CheY